MEQSVKYNNKDTRNFFSIPFIVNCNILHFNLHFADFLTTSDGIAITDLPTMV